MHNDLSCSLQSDVSGPLTISWPLCGNNTHTSRCPKFGIGTASYEGKRMPLENIPIITIWLSWLCGSLLPNWLRGKSWSTGKDPNDLSCPYDSIFYTQSVAIWSNTVVKSLLFPHCWVCVWVLSSENHQNLEQSPQGQGISVPWKAQYVFFKGHLLHIYLLLLQRSSKWEIWLCCDSRFSETIQLRKHLNMDFLHPNATGYPLGHSG